MVVVRIDVGHPRSVGNLHHILPPIRVVLVRTEEAKIPGLHVQLHGVAEKSSHDPRGLCSDGAWNRHLNGVILEVGQTQIPEQETAIGMRRGAHTAFTLRGQNGELGLETAALVEELFRTITLHPFFENPDVLRILMHPSHWYLMRTPAIFGALAIDLCRASPSLGRT